MINQWLWFNPGPWSIQGRDSLNCDARSSDLVHSLMMLNLFVWFTLARWSIFSGGALPFVAQSAGMAHSPSLLNHASWFTLDPCSINDLEPSGFLLHRLMWVTPAFRSIRFLDSLMTPDHSNIMDHSHALLNRTPRFPLGPWSIKNNESFRYFARFSLPFWPIWCEGSLQHPDQSRVLIPSLFLNYQKRWVTPPVRSISSHDSLRESDQSVWVILSPRLLNLLTWIIPSLWPIVEDDSLWISEQSTGLSHSNLMPNRLAWCTPTPWSIYRLGSLPRLDQFDCVVHSSVLIDQAV